MIKENTRLKLHPEIARQWKDVITQGQCDDELRSAPLSILDGWWTYQGYLWQGSPQEKNKFVIRSATPDTEVVEMLLTYDQLTQCIPITKK